MIALFTMGLTLSSSAFSGVPKPFEGVITYKITYPDATFPKEQMAMMPQIFTITIKGTKSRTEINAGGMGTQVEITDYVTKTKTNLIDVMGQKYAIKQTADAIQKQMAKEPQGKVQLTGETKNIAGYNCKKAIVTTDDDGVKTTLEVYYTEELGAQNANFDNPTYKDINGVMMEFTMKTPQISMKFTATTVEKKNVSEKLFEIPEGYTLTTEEELKAKFGGMGGEE